MTSMTVFPRLRRDEMALEKIALPTCASTALKGSSKSYQCLVPADSMSQSPISGLARTHNDIGIVVQCSRNINPLSLPYENQAPSLDHNEGYNSPPERLTPGRVVREVRGYRRKPIMRTHLFPQSVFISTLSDMYRHTSVRSPSGSNSRSGSRLASLTAVQYLCSSHGRPNNTFSRRVVFCIHAVGK